MRLAFLTLAFTATFTSVAITHHSFAASYFEEQSVTIEGSVVEFAFRSPHAWVYVDVTDANGKVTRYGAEWANPNRLTRDGITSGSLRSGDRVTITGSPGRKASENQIHLKRIERPADGWQWRGGRSGGRNGGRR
ncbi:MAG TPA: DUF6152 family protein [Vicinamibacterales bacterium]|nr:DUF6152 family protein [Vicinamibacterales bacterium]